MVTKLGRVGNLSGLRPNTMITQRILSDSISHGRALFACCLLNTSEVPLTNGNTDTVAERAGGLARSSCDVEKVFHDDSYGYRPGRSPVDAVRVCRERCWRRDWGAPG